MHRRPLKVARHVFQRPPWALAALCGALALAVPSAASAAPTASAGADAWVKPADPEPLGTSRTLSVGEGAFARTLPGRSRLLVTFADTVSAASARERLDGLGRLVVVLPEAGVWGLDPVEPARARAGALAREGVAGAEWSLARSFDVRTPPPLPAALSDVRGFTDPLFTPELQWGLLRGPAWTPSLTGLEPRPRVAILDSGVDPSHEEWAGPASPLVAPFSSVKATTDASDWGLSGHGTHVAGIAAAPANGVGVVGVAPARASSAQIIPVQISDPRGLSTDETMIRGIRWSVRRGAGVISISSGGAGFSRAFQDTILWAAKRGALVVASVGNEGDSLNTLNYPAAYRRVIGVGALCDDLVTSDCPTAYGVARFSNFNRSVDLIAPGVNILSSVPLRVDERRLAPGYALKDGTSMAAPYVAGVAALIQASNGNQLSPYQLARQLANTATDVGPRGYDIRSGEGAVNPLAAVTVRAPVDDTDEVNDDIKWVDGAARANERNSRQDIEATIDRFDDPEDVVPVVLRRGERLRVTLTHEDGVLGLYLWGPRTRTVATTRRNVERNLLRFNGRDGTKVAVIRARRTGRHYVNVFARSGRSDYRLSIVRGG